jgi:pimeloyl-ACP methyl ester carboxylesterase
MRTRSLSVGARWRATAALAVCLLLVCRGGGAQGRVAVEAQRPAALDGEYRKLEDLVTILRARNVEQYAVDPARGIAEASYVPIGGIEQWVTIRGEDRRNAVLLFLHGGPGDVTNPWSFALFAPWERQFTVVQWDQRGAGRTLRRSGRGVAPTLTVARLAQDGIELAEYLRRHLGKDKIVLVGHSFGSILGVLMARARPDLFYAYVGTGQVADETRNYPVAYEALLAKARADGNERAVADLRRVGPPPWASGEGYGVERRWANAFEGADGFLAGTLGLALVAPGGSVQDINDSVDGQMLSGERLVPQARSMRPQDLGLDFAIPMLVFQGGLDFTTPTALARQYLEAMRAPSKAFVQLDGGHFAVFLHADEFLQQLVARVLPLTGGAGGGPRRASALPAVPRGCAPGFRWRSDAA